MTRQFITSLFIEIQHLSTYKYEKLRQIKKKVTILNKYKRNHNLKNHGF